MVGPGKIFTRRYNVFYWYIDTKNNGEGLKKCILNGPYVPTSVLIQAVPAAEGRPAVQQHTAIETVLNMTPENKEHFQSEKEAIFLALACHQKPQRSNATSSSTRQSESTRHKGKEVAKPITPQSESVSEEDSDPEQLRWTRYHNKGITYDNQSRKFENQWTKTVAGVGKQEAKKVVKDYAYHKEMMMLCASNYMAKIHEIVQLILFIVDSGCTKHMTGNLKLLCNFVEKFLGTVRFRNDQFAPILGYGDLCKDNVTIKGLIHQKFLKIFSRWIQRNLQAQVISVRTDRGTEFLNKTLHAYFKEEGIEHQTSTP
ncbi:retrovirus-related pol polyprotein from transposon TNT 1-94 [Tanacetum coccineum]